MVQVQKDTTTSIKVHVYIYSSHSVKGYVSTALHWCVSVSHQSEGHLHEIHSHVTRTLSGHGGHVRKYGEGIVLYSSNDIISSSRISSSIYLTEGENLQDEIKFIVMEPNNLVDYRIRF